jgi:hypothetical protein
MRTLICFLIALPLSLSGQSTCAHPFEAGARAGHEIAMNLRAGDITVVGTDSPVVRVSCTMSDRDAASDIKISFAADHLTIRGGTHKEVHFQIEVPRTTNLRIRCSAGNLSVSGVNGDKDVELNAGNLSIMVGDPATYRYAEASVLAGDLRASAFGAEHDGLFRSFKHENPAGHYRLRAQLLAGNLTLR